MAMETMIHRGAAVKALPNGHIEGYLIVFGDADTPDLSAEKDFFTANTDFGLEDGMKSAVYYAHALDPTIKNRRLTNVSMKVDEVGVWVEGQMKARDEYEKALLKMAEAGKLGWSSGTASHLVTRKAVETESGTVHEILSWPLGLDASLTPTPAEPRANASYTLKSLAAMIEATPAADATKSRTDFTYDDLRALLEQEWNEDFGPVVASGYDCDSWGQQFHVIAMDDTTCVAQRGWQGELLRRAYTVTAGNDVTWGDPEEVARTTSFVAVTDGDDGPPMMAGKQADVAALKAMLRASMTLDDHASIVQDAMEGFAARAESLCDLTAVKAGRAMSASRHAKLTQIHAGMQTAMAAMAGHVATIGEVLDSTDPDAKKEIEDFAALRGHFLRIKSDLLHLTG